MPIDYSDRQLSGAGTANRNRPRKKSVGGIVLLSLTALVLSYVMGLATGWLLFGQQPGKVQIPKPPVTAATPPLSPPPVPAPQAATPQPPAGTTVQTAPLPLTFYETLPKGEKSVMGSGLNPPPQRRDEAQRSGTQSPPQPSPPPAPTASRTPSGEPQSPAERKKAESDAGKRPSPETSSAAFPNREKEKLKPVVPEKGGGKGYTVQILSTSDRTEAESLKKRYEARGIAIHLVPFEQNGRTWYRVRSGHALTHGEAKSLAQSIGSGAIVVAE